MWTYTFLVRIILFLSEIFALNSASSVYTTPVEDDLEKLKNIFTRSSMYVINEFSNSRRDQRQYMRSSFVPSNLRTEFDEETGISEDDILVEERQKNHSIQKRRIIRTEQYGIQTRWPNNTIPYEFDYDATDLLKTKFYTAINLWQEHSCVRFEPYSPAKHPYHKSMILVKNRGQCAARVGYVIDPSVKLTVSDVFLPDHCPQGSIIHELGHVIGFRHEHTRTDRGKHIIVHYERMQPAQRLQYEPMLNGQQGYYGIYYDLFSIMHYSTQGGLLESLDHKRSFLMGQRFTLSFSDIKMANMAYTCNEKCPEKNCENEGFVNAKCECQCPEYITGDLCQYVVSERISKRGTNDPKLNCGFERGLCGWVQDVSRDSHDWTLNSGYIRMGAFDETLEHSNAVLLSPEIELMGKFCLEFSFRVYKSVGSLNIKIRSFTGDLETIWSQKDGHGGDWLQASTEFSVEIPGFLIIFEADITELNGGEIAVDNIKFNTNKDNDCGGKRRAEEASITWSEWTDWSRCSVSCGQGFMIRKRICSVANLCQGKAFETKPCTVNKSCFKNNSSILKSETNKHRWSDWEWSECTNVLNCGRGVRTKQRTCRSDDDNRPISSFKCVGPSLVISECSLPNCLEPTTNTVKSNYKKNGHSWSEWSECSNTCGNGVKSRTRQCFDGELNCVERQLEQMTCTAYEKCTDNRYFKVCSFDKKENCSIETIEPNWLVTGKENNPHLASLFGNFIYLKNATESSQLQSQLVEDEANQGQCLFFNYYLRNGAELQVNKILPDSNSNETLFTADKNSVEKWLLAFITVKSPQQQSYFIQFNAQTSSAEAESLIALDNIVLHPVEFCRILRCSFDDSNCMENLFPYQEIQEGVWTRKQHWDNKQYYLSADLDRIRPGKKSFYGFPVINPLHSKMCVKFSYFINSSGTDLRLVLVWKRIDLKQLWSHSPYNKAKTWQKVMLDIDEAMPFQFILDVYKKSEIDLGNSIGIDDLEVTYGKCNQEELKELEREELVRQRESLKSRKRSVRSINKSRDTCGGIYDLKSRGTLLIESPGYPNSYKHNQTCTFLIKAPKNLKVFIKILDLDIEDSPGKDYCNDYLELRYFNLAQPGPKFCGSLSKYKGMLTFTSFEDTVMIIFYSDWINTRRGFKLQANMAI